jgi:alanyl-tRNA synthetase
MHPLVPYLLGQEHPSGKRLTDYQKCVRTGDIDSVGDESHLTFFEMLGNWSLGDYFKEEAIRMSWEFLTSPQWLGIPKEKLGVTVFAGETAKDGTQIPRDDESAGIWKKAGLPEKRIAYLPREDNWWGPAGETGPCGPDSEMFYYTKGNPDDCEAAKAEGRDCKPGCKCGGWLEIWNDVFMQYNKDKDGHFVPMERKCVDTGMGVERTVTILSGAKSVYDTEIFAPIIKAIEGNIGTADGGSPYHYGGDAEKDKSVRIIADHIRSAVFILGDPKAVTPKNIGAGYVLRRLIRRSMRHARKLGLADGWMQAVAEAVVEKMKGPYPELVERHDFIIAELKKEADNFAKTLDKGEKEFNKMLPNLLKNPKKVMGGRVAFDLYETYGFPIELTEELAAENGMTVDTEGFKAAEKKHQEQSRTLGAGVFKAGLADNSVQTTRYHTATHLLQAALRQVLGGHVAQKGSNNTAERMRFDFSHPQAMTKEEIAKVEDIVNDAIKRDLPVTMEVMDLDAAKAAGAIALFGEKYDKQVKVYTIGNEKTGVFSKEVCGGPHVTHTGELGRFHIQKEQSSGAGVRRIRAVLESNDAAPASNP